VVDESLGVVALILGLCLEKRRHFREAFHVEISRDREVLKIRAEPIPICLLMA